MLRVQTLNLCSHWCWLRLADLTDNLFCQINEGNTTVAAFVDLRKAFDTVNTKILVNKLHNAGIRGNVLKWCKNYLYDRFADLFNSSFRSSLYPSEWSHGYVHLLPKQGSSSNPSNWRPITQTNIFGKCLEKVVHRKLLLYFTEHGVISDRQYGFLPGKSTQEAIFDLTTHIYSSNNNRNLMGLLFLDISKAFDCILHERLLYKLRSIGASNNVLNWFKSYLNRTQELTYHDVTSSTVAVPTGIGQGTILGPLIFIFYMNDIVDKMFYVKLSMYADDCVLYLSGNNWDLMRQKMQEDLNCFEHWGELNNLHLNVKKTKLLFIPTRSKLNRLLQTHLYYMAVMSV